jgi:hypothetical protein
MKIETTQIEIVRADEGFYLTQKNRTEDEAPIMTDSLYNPTWEYIEIPKSEGDAIMAEWEDLQNAKQEEMLKEYEQEEGQE